MEWDVGCGGCGIAERRLAGLSMRARGLRSGRMAGRLG